jgi:hypothetical protein
MSSTDAYDLVGGGLGDRAGSVPVSPGVMSPDGLREAGAEVVPPDLRDVESVLRAVAELTGMPSGLADHHGATAGAVLRRQPVRLVEGRVEGGYTSVFEVICGACGDDPDLDYTEISPRLQRLRGPHPLLDGVTAYEAHLAVTTHGVGDEPA